MPRSVLGIEDRKQDGEKDKERGMEDKEEEKEKEEERRREREEEEVRKLEEELEGLKVGEGKSLSNAEGEDGHAAVAEEPMDEDIEDDGYVPFPCSFCGPGVEFVHKMLFSSTATPIPGTPKETSPPGSPTLAPQGPSQLLTALLARLPDCTNRSLLDSAAVEFAFLNSKAARKRLVKVRCYNVLLSFMSIYLCGR